MKLNILKSIGLTVAFLMLTETIPNFQKVEAAEENTKLIALTFGKGTYL